MLIVEDDLMIADLLEENLIDAGHHVCAIAHNVKSAVEFAELHRPEIAIIDINLGAGGLGTDIARMLTSSWPMGILYASGTGLWSLSRNTIGTAVILKPYSSLDMLVAIESVADIVTMGSTTRTLPRGVRLLGRDEATRVAA